MDSDNTLTQVRSGMLVFSADGKRIGKVWHVYARDTETYVEVHPISFWAGIVAGFVPSGLSPDRGHLFLPGSTVADVSGKRVVLALDRPAVMTCTNRPAWLPREEVRMPGLL